MSSGENIVVILSPNKKFTNALHIAVKSAAFRFDYNGGSYHLIPDILDNNRYMMFLVSYKYMPYMDLTEPDEESSEGSSTTSSLTKDAFSANPYGAKRSNIKIINYNFVGVYDYRFDKCEMYYL